MKAKRFRRRLFGFGYGKGLKPILFMNDPEKVHKRFIRLGRVLGENSFGRKIVSGAFDFEDKRLEQNILGIKFRNPVGLSAGFDKNAEAIKVMEKVGFGFVEVGAVTAKPCEGNKGLRMWRIPEGRGLRVNLGLNNKGVDEISERLQGEKYGIPFGVNVAKTNCKETCDDKIGIEDYVYSLKKLEEKDVGSYYTLNISCPNAFGGRPFSDPKKFEKLMKEVNKIKLKKPLFVKLSPDLTEKELSGILKISEQGNVKGFICSNLTKKHEIGEGGLSGKLVEEKANELLRKVYKKTKKMKKKYVLIGVGGIFSAEDAYKKIKLGANLVQMITGMVYQGPQIIGEINEGLVELLEKEGYKNLGEAVGTAR